MRLAVMRAYFPKAKSKCITYRSYHSFNKDYFRYDLNNALKNVNHYKIFEEGYLAILNKHASIKRKFIRANERPFMSKALKKAMMKRSRLKNIYLKDRSIENKNAYKTQRNSCVRLVRREKENYFQSLDTGIITGNKRFWKTIKRYSGK